MHARAPETTTELEHSREQLTFCVGKLLPGGGRSISSTNEQRLTGGTVMRFGILCLCVLLFALNGEAARAGNVLISADEGALPPSSDATKIPVATRAITRRPDLILVSPTKSVNSPFELQFKFQAHGSSGIKPESFHLVYLKSPTVDLTKRVLPYVQANGLVMPQAEAPAGRHVIEARIADSDGRETVAVFAFEVVK